MSDTPEHTHPDAHPAEAGDVTEIHHDDPSEHEYPVALGGIKGIVAHLRDAVLSGEERRERDLAFHQEVAKTVRAPRPTDPTLLSKTRREERRELKAARAREKMIGHSYEQWSYERWNVEPERDLDARGNYRGGKLAERQLGDIGTPAFVSRVAAETSTKAERKSKMKQHKRHVKLGGKIAAYLANNDLAQTGDDKASAKIRQRRVRLPRR